MGIFPRRTGMSIRSRAFLLIAGLSSLMGCSDSSFSNANSGDWSDTYAILGGTDVQPKDPVAFSTVMLLNLESSEVCTGTLVSERVLLTAAHCVPKETEHLQVFFSVNPLAEGSLVESAVIDRAEIHSDFNPDDSLNSVDVALLLLSVKAPEFYEPVSLAVEEDYHVEKHVVLAGYGVSSALKSEGFGRLRKVFTTISAVQDFFFEVDQRSGKGICDGDSGGPVFEIGSGKMKLMGVSKLMYDKSQSGVTNCLTTSQFTSFEGVSIQKWIQDFIQKSLADTAK